MQRLQLAPKIKEKKVLNLLLKLKEVLLISFSFTGWVGEGGGYGKVLREVFISLTGLQVVLTGCKRTADNPASIRIYLP